MAYCAWYRDILPGTEEKWGNEAVNLHLLNEHGVVVPPGFVVQADGYTEFIRQHERNWKKLLTGISVKNISLLSGAAHDIRTAVRTAALPAELEKSLRAYYAQLRSYLLHQNDQPIHLTLQAQLEQPASLSKIITRPADFLKAYKELYSLTLTEQSLATRLESKVGLFTPGFAVEVQMYDEPEFSGEAFVHDSETHDDLTIQIEAVHLKQPKLSNLEIHDTYRIDKKSLVLLSRKISKQWWAENASGKYVSPAHLGKEMQTLTDERAIQLARLIRLGQEAFSETERFSWVYAHKQFMITRVIPYQSEESPEAAEHPRLLLRGLPGCLGRVTGPVRVIKSSKDLLEVKKGEIVVLEKLPRQDLTSFHLVAGLVAEVGTSASKEAKLARQLGIPAVLGVADALVRLRDGQYITLDGAAGTICSGIVSEEEGNHILPSQLITGTKLYATVIDPFQVNLQQVAVSDGVGLLRGEFIIRMLGIHPEDVLRHRLADEYNEVFAEGLEQILQAAYPKPVHYQLHDVSSADLLGLRRRHQDRHEPNPLLGYRGSYRLLNEPELLDLEIVALTRLVLHGMTNLKIMIPMARKIDEVERLIHYVRSSALAKEISVDMWVKCETPSLLIQMEELCELPIQGVCFDVPALSQFIVGFDKGNYQVGHHADQTDPGVMQGIAYALEVCQAAGISTMVTGEQDELRPEVLQMAVEAGVVSISVHPEMLSQTRALVASIEQRMVLQSLLAEG